MLDDLTFEILRSAITVARVENIQSLPELRSRLLDRYPEQENAVEAALAAWAKRAGAL